jgi:hypothetical protein
MGDVVKKMRMLSGMILPQMAGGKSVHEVHLAKTHIIMGDVNRFDQEIVGECVYLSIITS